jgi:hypothetical protein
MKGATPIAEPSHLHSSFAETEILVSNRRKVLLSHEFDLGTPPPRLAICLSQEPILTERLVRLHRVKAHNPDAGGASDPPESKARGRKGHIHDWAFRRNRDRHRRDRRCARGDRRHGPLSPSHLREPQALSLFGRTRLGAGCHSLPASIPALRGPLGASEKGTFAEHGSDPHGRRGTRITQDSKSSPRRIDLGMAAVMSHDRAKGTGGQDAQGVVTFCASSCS